MLKPCVAGAVASTNPPAPAGAGNGSTGARWTVHTTSLV